MSIPQSHVDDALKLIADGEVYLYEIWPLAGGTIYCKSDNDVDWQGHTWEGLPIGFTGEELVTTDGSRPTPRMTIGQQDVDLLPFKGLMFDGGMDYAKIVRHLVKVDDLVNNRNIKQTTYWRVKRVESYSRTKISLVVASFSGAVSQTLPFRQYIPPAFPWVEI